MSAVITSDRREMSPWPHQGCLEFLTCGPVPFASRFAAMSHPRIRFVRKHTAAVIFAVLPIIFSALPASAETRQAKERTARKACLNGDFATGVSILSDLFIDTKDPTYIFNQGRCFEQNRRYQDAVARFEEYLRTDLSPQSRTAGEKHLADCQQKLAQERESLSPQPAPVTPPVPAFVPSPDPTAKTESAVAAVAESPVKAEPGQRRWGLITGGIVTAAVGVGGVVTGLLFNLKANSMVNDWENKPGSYSSSNEDKQKTYRTLTWVGYGAGGALMVTGAILMVIGGSSHTGTSGDVALAPSVGPSQFGAMLTGAF
jgi:hypothetical protein